MAFLRVMSRGLGSGTGGDDRTLVSGLVETTDGAHIYVEHAGSGRPLVLVHGWTMSSGFWQKQLELADRFHVITLDLRGHGNSSKILHGHTIPDYGRDVHAVMGALNLQDVVLAGWSLAGPVVLECLRLPGRERIAGLALVECTPAPMSPEPWNTHVLRSHNFVGLHASFAALRSNRREYGKAFINGMFHSGTAPDKDLEFMLARHLQTPTDPARAIYSDYAMRDLDDMLPEIHLPVLAAFGDSNHPCFGPTVGEHLKASMPDCRLELFHESGHMPFWEEPEKFNQVLAEFADGIG